MTILSLNETELGILIGRELHSKEEYKEAAHEMLKKGVKHLLVTLGSKGCLLMSEEGEEFLPANKVKAVDTTAAGDCFTGAFAVAISQGKSEKDAIAFAQKASAIAVTRFRCKQSSVPSLEEVLERFMSQPLKMWRESRCRHCDGVQSNEWTGYVSARSGRKLNKHRELLIFPMNVHVICPESRLELSVC